MRFVIRKEKIKQIVVKVKKKKKEYRQQTVQCHACGSISNRYGLLGRKVTMTWSLTGGPESGGAHISATMLAVW